MIVDSFLISGAGLAAIAINRMDPTQTLTLRNRYAAAMRGRFNMLRQLTVAYILSEAEGTGLGEALFMGWLYRAIDSVILGVSSREEGKIKHDNWQENYIRLAFASGVRYADRFFAQAGETPPPTEFLGVPIYQDQITKIAGEVFDDLIKATGAMAEQIRQVFLKAIGEGKDLKEIAKRVTDRIMKIGRTRGEIIARTNIIGTHAEATLTRFAALGVVYVTGVVEFATAGDNRVCPVCKHLEGNVYAIEDARHIIPVHPGCRCAWKPVLKL